MVRDVEHGCRRGCARHTCLRGFDRADDGRGGSDELVHEDRNCAGVEADEIAGVVRGQVGGTAVACRQGDSAWDSSVTAVPPNSASIVATTGEGRQHDALLVQVTAE